MTVVRFICTACKRLAVEVRTPVAVEPVKYAPTVCSWCGGTAFLRKEAA